MSAMNVQTKRIILFVFLLLVLYMSCSSFMQNQPAFKTSEPVFTKVLRTDSGETAGVRFDFLNKSDKCIKMLEIKMTVFDTATGSPAFDGIGVITNQYHGKINAGEQRSMFIPLEDYCPAFDERELTVDLFYISRIVYSDDTEWKDYLGITQV